MIPIKGVLHAIVPLPLGMEIEAVTFRAADPAPPCPRCGHARDNHYHKSPDCRMIYGKDGWK